MARATTSFMDSIKRTDALQVYQSAINAEPKKESAQVKRFEAMFATDAVEVSRMKLMTRIPDQQLRTAMEEGKQERAGGDFMRIAGGMLGIAAIGIGIGLSFTPVGWIAIAIGVIIGLSLLGLAIGGKLLRDVGEHRQEEAVVNEVDKTASESLSSAFRKRINDLGAGARRDAQKTNAERAAEIARDVAAKATAKPTLP